MDYVSLTESGLSPSQVNTITTKARWIENIRDDIIELPEGSSAYIDISDKKYNTKEDYIRAWEEVKASVSNTLYVLIELNKLFKTCRNKLYDINNVNPVAAVYEQMRRNAANFRTRLAGIKFIFSYTGHYADSKYFIITADRVTANYYKKFAEMIDSIAKPDRETRYLTGQVKTIQAASPKIKDVETDPMKPVENKEANKKNEDSLKKEISDEISIASKNAKTEEEAMNNIDDNYTKRLLQDLSSMESQQRGASISVRRKKRMIELDNQLAKTKVKGKSVKEIIDEPEIVEELPSTDIKIDTINDEWKDLKFMNFNKEYDMNDDIVKIFYFFSKKPSYPISIQSINVEDTSTCMDYLDTYTVACEDVYGKKFTWTVDIPQLIDNRYLMLRGNEKVISGQLALLPCTKTDPDTVQIVSNYNKVFVRRTGTKGKSTVHADQIVKTVNKLTEQKYRNLKVAYGDFSNMCMKYKDLPMDYVDLASMYNSIEIIGKNHIVIDFDQDRLRSQFGTKGNSIPIGYFNSDNPIWYNTKDADGGSCSYYIANMLSASDDKFRETISAASRTEKVMCSIASILNTHIPVIVILGYLNGLIKTLDMANINYRITNSKRDIANYENYVRIGKEYIIYQDDYSATMLLNGLTRIPDFDQYTIVDLENRSTWVNILGDIKDRLLSDGLENFDDLFVDPITEEVCKECGDATTFTGLLLQANQMLADNSYNKHTDISVNRYRTSEIIPAYLYNVLSKSYASYANGLRKGRRDAMSIKRTAVIDAIMLDPTQGDKSTLSALMDIEAANATSFKGLSGLNSDRAYGLDKRTFDKSMVNKIALSTGFAANVGITRQSTIDMDIKGKRGYIKPDSEEDVSITKTFSMTEAITPFGVTHDDPFRSAMTFIQTSKHSMRTKASAPLLITNGADEAIPHMTTDKFAFKAKDKGKVSELVPNDYMIITYDNGGSDFINLKESIEKNSDGGMYILLHLVPDFKVGQRFKKDDIVAHDKMSFSNNVGGNDNLAYNVGALVKVALPNTDMGYEDSTACSHWMTEALSSDVIIKKEITLSPNTNVYELVKPGQPIQEGDPLILFQNSFEEKDANLLLKNITDDELVSDLGRIRLRSHYTGMIQDVVVYRTQPTETYSESIQKIINDFDKRVAKKKALYKKYKIPGVNKIEPDYPLPPTGELKNVGDGIKINVFIKYHDKFSVGDKNVAQSAAKGVNKEIFPEGKEPRSEYRPNEPIHAVYAIGSFNARMIDSVLLSGAINKGLIELDRQVKDIMGIPWKTLEEIQFDDKSDEDLHK